MTKRHFFHFNLNTKNKNTHTDTTETWVFLYFPITIMLIINVILFVWSAWGLHKSGSDVSPDKKKALTYK